MTKAKQDIKHAIARINIVNNDKANPLPIRAMACSFDAILRTALAEIEQLEKLLAAARAAMEEVPDAK